MSPELFEGRPADHRVDIWAIGVVLYELLAGVRPFDGRDAAEVAAAVQRGAFEPLRSRRPDVPAPLAETVERCLRRDAAARYASATAVLIDLRTALERSPEDARGAALVVLPFETDGAEEHLGSGLAEDLAGGLSRTRGLRVIAPASSRRLAGEREPLESARSLGVGYALSGRIESSDRHLAVEATLHDARRGARIWSALLDGDPTELLVMRQEVVRSVLGRLGLDGPPEDGSGGAPIDDPRAYEAYLRARHEVWRFSSEGMQRARRFIETALGIVGDSDTLHGMLGHVAAISAESGLDPSPGVVDEVERHADRVFSLNPRSARGYWLKAWAAFRRGDLGGAIRAGRRGHALVPDDPDLLLLLGYLEGHAGRNVDARALLARALLIDPLNPLTQAMQGFVPVLEGRFEEAVECYALARGMDPESPFFAAFHGWALALSGRRGEAIGALKETSERFAPNPFAAYAAALAMGLEGRGDDVQRAVTPELLAAAHDSEMFARELAHCFALAGDHAAALDWLERSVELGMWNHDFIARHDWFLADLRGEPRFHAILGRIREAAAVL